jgi:hypothetical protein
METRTAGLGTSFGSTWPLSDASILGIDPSSSINTDFHTSFLNDPLAALDSSTDLNQYQSLSREQEMSPINTSRTPSSLENVIQGIYI